VHPVLGVSLDTAFEGPGARITDKPTPKGQQPVRRDGPADKAGLKPGDVVLAIDGKNVAGAEELIVAVRSKSPGDTVTLTVRRDGKEIRLPVELAGEGDSGE
jgi:putative serine protease PepD